MDLGISMNPLLDIGQIEGAFLMGVGLCMMEELRYRPDGTLATNNTWEYKIPGVMDIPIDSRVTLLANAPNPAGVLRSRAVGEPPLLMGCTPFWALKAAINSARLDAGLSGPFRLDTPATVANVLDTLVSQGVVTPATMKIQ